MINNRPIIWPDIRYFRIYEFDSPDSPGSGDRMNLSFVYKLDQLRDAVKIPLIITSGYRSPVHNDKIQNSVDGSAHTLGHAADIRALSSMTRFRILEAALRLGFRRIGVGSTFIHLDDAPTKPQDVVWTYPDSRRA